MTKLIIVIYIFIYLSSSYFYYRLIGCAKKVIYSAWDNYANFACDVGGYRGNDVDPAKELFIRWAQFSAFLPFVSVVSIVLWSIIKKIN